MNPPKSLLVAFSDSLWTGDPDDCPSTVGACILLVGNLITWASKKQPRVSQSNPEAEYWARARTTAEVRWCCYLLNDLGVFISGASMVKCDNQSMLFLATNPVTRAKSRHMEVDFHFVRELVQLGSLRLQYVPRMTKLPTFSPKVSQVRNFKNAQLY